MSEEESYVKPDLIRTLTLEQRKEMDSLIDTLRAPGPLMANEGAVREAAAEVIDRLRNHVRSIEQSNRQWKTMERQTARKLARQVEQQGHEIQRLKSCLGHSDA